MTKIRKKRCAICNKQFLPITAFQKCCSVDHAIQYVKLKDAAKKADLNKLRNEKFDIEKLATVTKSTLIVFNSYIRLRDKGKPCPSCGVRWNSRFEAGHAYSASKFNAIRFDFDCVHGQCFSCNNLKEGNYDNYLLKLPDRIGVENAQRLAKRAIIAKQVTHTWTRHELSEIRKEVSRRKKEL